MSLSQTDRLYNVLLDQKPHRTDELLKKVYGSEKLGIARIGARVYDLKKKYGVTIAGWHDRDRPTLYWYLLISPTVFKK